MKRALVLYVPVLHEGYLKFFKKYKNKVDALYILGPNFIKEFMPLHQEIRALDPAEARIALAGFSVAPLIKILDRKSLGELKGVALIAADEEISRNFIKKYYPRSKVVFEKIFLRWDEKNVNTAFAPKGVKVSRLKFDRDMMSRITIEGKKSSDWWRHVGAAIVREKKIILESHNRHVPSEHMPYMDGDPRNVIPAGTQSHLSTAIHAEQSLIAEAARRGISLQDTSIYLNVFPCPVCAKLIAYSGIKKCFFGSGFASLDGERVMRANGVKIIAIQ